MTLALDEVVRRIKRLEHEVQHRRPQLVHSAVDDGALIATVGGQLTSSYGLQWDGTSGPSWLAGPVPPTPSLPTLEVIPTGVRVRWDGTYADPQIGYASPVVTPMDFARCEVHLSTDPDFVGDNFATLHSVISSPRGGTVDIAYRPIGTPLYARLVVRTLAGKASLPGLTAGPVNAGAVALGDLGFNIAQYSGGNTIYYTTAPATPVAPAWGFTPGDLWLEQTATATGLTGGPPTGTPLYTTQRWNGLAWSLLQDQGISGSLASAIAAQTTANAKAQQFTQPTAPAYIGAANTAFWVDTANGNRLNVWNGASWDLFQLGNGAIQPNSLVASNVIATGTVTAALLEALMVLANTVIAGNNLGDHSALAPDGFHLYKVVAGEGMREIARFAIGVGNYLTTADATGRQVATLDESGRLTVQALYTNSILYQGTELASELLSLSDGVVGRASLFTSGVDIQPIFAPYGLIEVGCSLVAGRAYAVSWMLTWQMQTVASPPTGEVRIRVRHTSGSDGDTVTQPARPTASTSLTSCDATYIRSYSDTGAGAYHNETGTVIVTPNITSRFRYLLQIERGGGGSASDNILVVNSASDVPLQLFVTDLGPAGPVTGAYQPGGATLASGSTPSSPTSVTQQYYQELAPAGYASYSGGGTLRSDTSDVVQGWDPSGFNGDGGGYWWFNLPSITGTVDRIDWYVYCNHTYFNNGGTAIWNIIPSGGGSNFGASKLRGDWYVSGYPKGGAATVTLPSDWWAFFRNAASPRAIAVSAGRSNGTNEQYYCRFDGPSARMRIWYTQ